VHIKKRKKFRALSSFLGPRSSTLLYFSQRRKYLDMGFFPFFFLKPFTPPFFFFFPPLGFFFSFPSLRGRCTAGVKRTLGKTRSLHTHCRTTFFLQSLFFPFPRRFFFLFFFLSTYPPRLFDKRGRKSREKHRVKGDPFFLLLFFSQNFPFFFPSPRDVFLPVAASEKHY